MPAPPFRFAQTLVAVVLAVLAHAAIGWAVEPFPLPPFSPVERGAYRARETQNGHELWRVDWVVHQRRENGRTILDLQENGNGIQDTLVPSSWTVRMTIDLWGKEPRLTSIREGRDDEGHPKQVEEREFAYASGTGRVKTSDLTTGETDLHNIRVHGRSYTPEILPAALRLLPEAKDQEMRFDLVTRGGYTLGMLAKVVGRERIEVPAGSFDCYKIELDPTGLFGIIADLTMARIFMWHTVAAPHFWVKYEGPLGGPGSPHIIRELLRFETGAGR